MKMKIFRIATIKSSYLKSTSAYGELLRQGKTQFTIKLLTDYEIHSKGELLTLKKKYLDKTYIKVAEEKSAITGSLFYTCCREHMGLNLYRDFEIS